MIEKIRSRMTSADAWQKLVNILARIGKSRGRRACPDAVIQFSGDMCEPIFRGRGDPEDSEEEEEPVIEIPQTSMWPNLSAQNAARSLRLALGYSANNLVVGQFVAYLGEYTDETKEEEKQESWIGAIQRLAHDDGNANTVEIKRWHTNKLDNMSSQRNPKYILWPHSTKHPAIEWIDPQRILYQFPKLTDKGNRVHQKYRTQILAAIGCRELDKHQPTDPDTIGLGPEQNAPNKRRRINNDAVEDDLDAENE